MILKKSSSRSFQLPSRPDGKLELIRHEGAETKFQGISAKAKAKQLARSQLSSNELFDKLIESDVKEGRREEDKVEEVNNRSKKAKTELGVEKEAAGNSVVTTAVTTSEPPAVTSPPPASKNIETYDFECDTDLMKITSVTTVKKAKSPVKKSETNISDSKALSSPPPVSSSTTSPSKCVVSVSETSQGKSSIVVSPTKPSVNVTTSKPVKEVKHVIVKDKEPKELAAAPAPVPAAPASPGTASQPRVVKVSPVSKPPVKFQVPSPTKVDQAQC